MGRSLNELIRDAGELPDSDRATLAEAAWSREIERRVREVDAGTVDLISWDEVRAELFA
jgi:putative addiction module component (TIGR02574 family)